MPRERCKDLVGKRVRLLRDLHTVGGTSFAAGTAMVVRQTHRGRFFLAEPMNRDDGVRQVARNAFEVVT